MDMVTAEIEKIKTINSVSKKLFDEEVKSAQNLIATGNIDAALQIAVQLSTYAWVSFTTYYTTYALEEIILSIGRKKMPNIVKPAYERSGKQRKILHVASELYEIGGHTPLLLKWIQRDKTSTHHLFLTRQSLANIPHKIFEQHGFHKEQIVWANSEQKPYLEVAEQLLSASFEYDMIVLHVHPDDVVPLLAFSKQKPKPVFFLNHADHCFWLGASVIDGIIHFRKSNIELDKVRRQLSIPQFVIPIPVDSDAPLSIDKKDVFTKYRIPQNYKRVLLTTSTVNKFQPFLDYNYFESVTPVLNNNPDTVLLIVGVGHQQELAIRYSHPQIFFLGTLFPDDLKEIEHITDLYIETIPISSFTAQLQVLLSQKPVHFMYAPPAVLMLFDHPLLYPESRKAWQEKLSHLITNDIVFNDYKNDLLNKVYQDFSTDAWHAGLKLFYGFADANAIVLPSSIKQDASFNNYPNEMFLYGISQKIKYKYLFFEEMEKKVRLNRLLHYLAMQLKFGKSKSDVLEEGFKSTAKRFAKLLLNKG